jgi:hypothetical protein
VQENHRILEDHLHALGVGHEVGGQVAAVELHALDYVEGGLDALGLFDGDHALLADLLHRLGEDLPDRRISVGGDRSHLGDLLARAGLLRLLA